MRLAGSRSSSRSRILFQVDTETAALLRLVLMPDAGINVHLSGMHAVALSAAFQLSSCVLGDADTV